MGLTLHHELGLPATTSFTDVTDRVRELHAAATRLPFATVGPLHSIVEGETFEGAGRVADPLEHFFRFVALTTLEGMDARTRCEADRLPQAVGFAVVPGRYSEAATFGLARVPPRDEEWHCLHDEPPVWHWYAFCKTQYASIVGTEHFVRCHTSLVALLDEAARLGFDVTVRDEGSYWETRDPNRLVAELNRMNHIVARMAGAVHDAIGAEHRVEATIFAHPRFEQLEMGG